MLKISILIVHFKIIYKEVENRAATRIVEQISLDELTLNESSAQKSSSNSPSRCKNKPKIPLIKNMIVNY